MLPPDQLQAMIIRMMTTRAVPVPMANFVLEIKKNQKDKSVERSYM